MQPASTRGDAPSVPRKRAFAAGCSRHSWGVMKWKAGGVAEEILAGGVANAGVVVRFGAHVLRPATARTEAIHDLLRYVRARGFDGVPEPVGVDPDGRERLVFIDGEVPCPPFPEWSQTDDVLASTSRLLAGFHRAVAGFEWPSGVAWCDELADPAGGPIMCHNDVCPENVVYRHGVAVGLLDFDFVAPGRPIYDLAQLAKMFAPIDTPQDAARWVAGRSIRSTGFGWLPMPMSCRPGVSRS